MSSLLTSGLHYNRGECGDWVYRGDWTLTDGIINYGDSAWTLISYNQVVGDAGHYGYFTFDLGTVYNLDYVRFGYAVWSAAHIYSPSTVIIQGSTDNFSASIVNLGTFVRTTDWSSANTSVSPITSRWSNNLSVSGNSYRYARFKIYYNDPAASDTAHAFQEFEVYGNPSSALKTINGLAKASVSKVNSLAIASVKTFNGLA